MKTTTITIENPPQVTKGFVPVPVKFADRDGENAIWRWACESAGEQHGEGRVIHEKDSDGYSRHMLLLQDYRGMPGAWFIEYTYCDNDGTNVERIYMGCKLAFN